MIEYVMRYLTSYFDWSMQAKDFKPCSKLPNVFAAKITNFKAASYQERSQKLEADLSQQSKLENQLAKGLSWFASMFVGLICKFSRRAKPKSARATRITRKKVDESHYRTKAANGPKVDVQGQN